MLCLKILVLFTLCTILNAIVCCLQLNTGRGADANLKVDYLGTDACWMAVCVFCRNAQVNLIVIIMTCLCIVMHLSICQLPNCNLFTQHVSYLLWRDTTSELWTPVHSFTLIIQPTASTVSFHLLQSNIIFHTMRLILCFQQAGEIDTLTALLGQSSLVVLCAGSKSTSQTFLHKHFSRRLAWRGGSTSPSTPLVLTPLTPSEHRPLLTGSITLVSY